MSRICLSTSDLFTLRVALGHAITANPAPSRDFPFPTESTEKLVALLDSLLLATAPGTTFAVEEAPNDQPYDAGADRSLRLADKVQQDLGVTNTGSGYLVSVYDNLWEIATSPSHFRLRIRRWRRVCSAACPLSLCRGCRVR
jgi:hypothetical protein